jgi:AraC-like DNA-binding protein
VFIRTGTFVARIAERESVVDANYVLFGAEGDAVVAMNAAKTTCTCTALQYSGGVPAFPRKAALCAPRLYLIHARMLNAARLARAGSLVDQTASELVLNARDTSPKSPFDNEQHTRTVCAIKQLMNQSLSKPISLLELSNRFYVSPFTISRWFHAETGLSLRLYVQRLRLRRALIYMLDERRSLTAIAIELGFYDEPHFSKAFHAEFGLPPGIALTGF